MASDIRVLSWNIYSLKAKLKKHRNAVLEIFKSYDIVLLQETFIGLMDDGREYPGLKIITEALPEEYTLVKLKDQTYSGRRVRPQKTMYMTYFSSNTKGVAILINKPHTRLKAFCKGGDYAWVHIQIGDQEYTFVSVYYHKDYPHLICNLMLEIFYSFWTAGLDAFKHRLVIGGDFNTTLDPDLDTDGKNSHHITRRKTLNEFLKTLKLTDVWREKHKSEREYTHSQVIKSKHGNKPKSKPGSKEKKKTKSRLDYVFMLEKDVKYVRRCEILREITLSDHSPMSVTLNYNTNDRRIQQQREE